MLIGDDAAAQLVGGHAVQGALHLKGNPLVGDAGLPLLQLSPTQMMGFMPRQHGVDLLVDGGIGLAEILPPLAVAHDDVLHAQILQHVAEISPGVSALLLKVHVLGATEIRRSLNALAAV